MLEEVGAARLGFRVKMLQKASLEIRLPRGRRVFRSDS
jgi:hypothetical protein